MDWQVLITDSALADLREIVEFIAQDDPPRQSS
jgi:plasmid stabilization system protein ParE